VDAEMEAEEIGHRDLSVGVVCKNYEEPGPRGSAAHFLLGIEMEGDPPGNENVEGGALTAVSAYWFTNISDSNKCQSSSPKDDDAVDVVSAATAVDVVSLQLLLMLSPLQLLLMLSPLQLLLMLSPLQLLLMLSPLQLLLMLWTLLLTTSKTLKSLLQSTRTIAAFDSRDQAESQRCAYYYVTLSAVLVQTTEPQRNVNDFFTKKLSFYLPRFR